jgi:hypothetical protein
MQVALFDRLLAQVANHPVTLANRVVIDRGDSRVQLASASSRGRSKASGAHLFTVLAVSLRLLLRNALAVSRLPRAFHHLNSRSRSKSVKAIELAFALGVSCSEEARRLTNARPRSLDVSRIQRAFALSQALAADRSVSEPWGLVAAAAL